jgi:hypothetical protein
LPYALAQHRTVDPDDRSPDAGAADVDRDDLRHRPLLT